MSDLKIDTDQWDSASVPTHTGSQDSNDITNDVNIAINSLNGALNAVGFIANARNFVTVMEEFGQGMEAALACISVDMVVVSSGVKSAAAAFTKVEADLTQILAQMEHQVPYFTNTKSTITLSTPTAADLSALNALEGGSSSSGGSSGIHLSYPKLNPSTTAAAGGTAAVALLLLGVLALA